MSPNRLTFFRGFCYETSNFIGNGFDAGYVPGMAMPAWANNNENVSVERNIYSITPAEQRIIDICEVSGLNRNQVILLQHEGYSDEDILGFSKEEADAILTKGMDNEAKSFYYAQIAQRPFDEYKDLFPNDFFRPKKIL